MLTTPPGPNQAYNTLLCLAAKTEITSKKPLLTLAKDLETCYLDPVDCIILTPIKVYCLSRTKTRSGSLLEFSLLQIMMDISNKFHKHTGVSLRLENLSYQRHDSDELKNQIDYDARKLYNEHCVRSTMGMFDDRYDNSPEWFRNGIWITPSSLK